MADRAFDLDAAAQAALEVYQQHSRSYLRMAQHVHDTILDKCDPRLLQNVTFREKDCEKFLEKASKREAGIPKYKDPLNDITDLAGVRVIVYVKDSVADVCKIISEIYDVEEQEDVGERVYKQGRFGYQSVHMLVRLDKKMYLGPEKAIKKAVCEIQVRTLLQHAWAEMEHDIQYKGAQVPIDIAKRFSALAGLLEIADGEFQRIQEDSQLLKESVQAKLVNDLTQQGLAAHKGNDPSGVSETENVHRVRDLVAVGRYEEALEWYNQRLEIQGTNHTLFIGRAKLYFLMGESSRALDDIENAAKLSPSDPVVTRTKTLIESGDVDGLKEQGRIGGAGTYDPVRLQEAFAALEAGDGVKSFEIFSQLELTGYSRAFALFNKSMSCALEDDLNGAKEFLTSLKIIPMTPMSVNIRTMEYLIARLGGAEVKEALGHIASSLAVVPHYSVSQSHLIHLLKGLEIRKPEISESVTSDLVSVGLPLTN